MSFIIGKEPSLVIRESSKRLSFEETSNNLVIFSPSSEDYSGALTFGNEVITFTEEILRF